MRWAALAALLACATASAGCGDDAPGGAGRPRLVVSAAASMTEALTRCSRAFEHADVRLSFAASGELAGQIRRGVRPDVFAAADSALPEALHREGLLETPVRFASNELVVALSTGSRVRSVRDLARQGVALAVGSRSAPVGIYAREALSRLPARLRRPILANVRSSEPDARGIVGKLTQGAADAGFAYATDVKATRGRLRSLRLPAALRPSVIYGAAVVRGARRPQEARRYVEGLVAGDCRAALTAAGFGPPP